MQPQASLSAPNEPSAHENLYAGLLKTWCDALVSLQVTTINRPALDGGILCPACCLVHGRCGDAVYPLLYMAHASGDSKYLQAALRVYEWSEQQVSCSDGSWVNEVQLNPWKGTTVFRAVALAEALYHHGSLLDGSTRRRWIDRLARAVQFLDGYITIETGNINYPITSAFCFALCAQVLGDAHYLDRARQIAHTALDYFTPDALLFGEGRPQQGVTAKGCRPVDLGYNVEESLQSLAHYALTAGDAQVLEQVVHALRTQMEFMLPDGAWDNSWGTRNYKWTWWGSRTSDGCHPGYMLLADYDPRFREVAWRNLELMAECTHDGLLYGGPHYYAHGDLPCVHHTFTHAKALATVLDRSTGPLKPTRRESLPRDVPYGLKQVPEIGTWLAAIGDWRATVTDYDWDYSEHGQSVGGGHASGGALSLLYHRRLGPILVAGMTEYQVVENWDQQASHDYPQETLTPRIECASNGWLYTSLSDFQAVLTASAVPQKITFSAQGRLVTARHQTFQEGDVRYHLLYHVTDEKVEIVAGVDAVALASVRFVLPIVSLDTEAAERVDANTVRVTKQNGRLLVRTNAPCGLQMQSAERIFSLVPGFECLPLSVALLPGQDVRIELSA